MTNHFPLAKVELSRKFNHRDDNNKQLEVTTTRTTTRATLAGAQDAPRLEPLVWFFFYIYHFSRLAKWLLQLDYDVNDALLWTNVPWRQDLFRLREHQRVMETRWCVFFGLPCPSTTTSYNHQRVVKTRWWCSHHFPPHLHHQRVSMTCWSVLPPLVNHLHHQRVPTTRWCVLPPLVNHHGPPCPRPPPTPPMSRDSLVVLSFTCPSSHTPPPSQPPPPTHTTLRDHHHQQRLTPPSRHVQWHVDDESLMMNHSTMLVHLICSHHHHISMCPTTHRQWLQWHTISTTILTTTQHYTPSPPSPHHTPPSRHVQRRVNYMAYHPLPRTLAQNLDARWGGVF